MIGRGSLPVGLLTSNIHNGSPQLSQTGVRSITVAEGDDVVYVLIIWLTLKMFMYQLKVTAYFGLSFFFILRIKAKKEREL